MGLESARESMGARERVRKHEREGERAREREQRREKEKVVEREGEREYSAGHTNRHICLLAATQIHRRFHVNEWVVGWYLNLYMNELCHVCMRHVTYE